MGVRKDVGESSLGVDMRQAEHVPVQFNGMAVYGWLRIVLVLNCKLASVRHNNTSLLELFGMNTGEYPTPFFYKVFTRHRRRVAARVTTTFCLP